MAGGTAGQMADDSRFLNSLNGSTDRYGEFKTFWGTGLKEIENAWASLGIKYTHKGLGNDRYELNGQQISHEEARQHAMKVTGHYMNRSDWDW